MGTIITIFFLVLSILSLPVIFFVFFTLCRFLFLEYINPWRADRGKKPFSRRFVMIVSLMFALAFIL